MGNEVPLAPLSASAERRRQRAVESLGLQVCAERGTDERLGDRNHWTLRCRRTGS